MRSTLTYLFILAIAAVSFAQTSWNFDKAHSSIGFNVDHMVVAEVEGEFAKFEGTFSADKDDFSDAQITFTVDVASITTDNEKRDGHLKSPDFFDVAKYPQMTFKSKAFTKTGNKTYKLVGDLTMRGVTKEVTLDVKYGGTIADPWGNTRAGFKISGALNRTDYGLEWNKILETGGLLVSEEVRIVGRFELIKSK